MKEQKSSSESLRDAIERSLDQLSERHRMTFDGVLGEPPKYIPEWAEQQFYSIRNRLLDIRGYESKTLIKLMDKYQSAFLTQSEKPESFSIPFSYPNGQAIDIYCFIDEIGFLAWLRWCISQGEKECGRLLGKGFYQERKKGADKTNGKIYASREYCIAVAREKWDEEQREEKTITRIGDMCTHLLYGLAQKEMWRPTSEKKVREWLSKAEKDGLLDIPTEARKAGRPSIN
ncbi:MAG: hypothetical protein ABW088_12560 [Sedimenticola sp.]